MSVQPDLFGEYDQAAATARHRQALQERSWTCPSCGTTEPSGWLLASNHGYVVGDDGTVVGIGGFPVGRHPIYRDHCLAQDLALSHLAFAVLRGDGVALDRARRRGRALGLDVDTAEAKIRAEYPGPSCCRFHDGPHLHGCVRLREADGSTHRGGCLLPDRDQRCGGWNGAHDCGLAVDHPGNHVCAGCGDVWNRGPWDDQDPDDETHHLLNRTEHRCTAPGDPS